MMEEKLLLYVFTCLTLLPYYISTIPLEAAFQGRCEEGTPCEQGCFNLHDFMYECYCHQGFYLHSNGYNCIAFNATAPAESEAGGASPGNIQIQIEVDIEPPEDTGSGDQLTGAQLEQLGLPAQHVHYTAAAAARGNTAELLQPGDIQVSYADTAGNTAGSSAGNTARDKAGITADNPARVWGGWEGADTVAVPQLEAEVEPPRALPDTAPAPAPASLVDNIYTLAAYCGLDCGPGECREVEPGTKRCLCPAGLGGARCEDQVSTGGVPRLSGHSHLALATLQNAYSDLHLAIEFRPEAGDGVLLITGQAEDMTGDYLALLLVDGFVELRLDCGTGPGLVRSRHRVQLRAWNHLAVFRHDWAVWLQLNRGPREEGRSQGLFSRITFNLPLYVGGVGAIRNVRSFLGLDTGMVGCVRRLEINDKYYSLETAAAGGDIIAGRDIGGCGGGESPCAGLTPPCGHGECRVLHQLPVCECGLGRAGRACQHSAHMEAAHFSGSSYIRYPGLGDSALLWLSLELSFKPESGAGILVYSGDSGAGDWVAVVLDQAHLVFLMELGSGVAVLRSEERVELGAWHNLTVTRDHGHVTLHVDGRGAGTAASPGPATQLSLAGQLWLGGTGPGQQLPAQLSAARLSAAGYRGCVRRLAVNSLPVQLLYSASGSVGVAECEAAPRPAAPHSAPAFSGRSYLAFNQSDILTNLIGNSNMFNLRVRLTSSDAILLWAGGRNYGDSEADFIMLSVEAGFVQFSYNLGSGAAELQWDRARVDDGRWHRIRVTRLDQAGSLQVDSGDPVTGRSPGHLTQLNTQPALYLGGLPEAGRGLVGCVAELSVGAVSAVDMLARAGRGRNVDICQHQHQHQTPRYAYP